MWLLICHSRHQGQLILFSQTYYTDGSEINRQSILPNIMRSQSFSHITHRLRSFIKSISICGVILWNQNLPKKKLCLRVAEMRKWNVMLDYVWNVYYLDSVVYAHCYFYFIPTYKYSKYSYIFFLNVPNKVWYIFKLVWWREGTHGFKKWKCTCRGSEGREDRLANRGPLCLSTLISGHITRQSTISWLSECNARQLRVWRCETHEDPFEQDIWRLMKTFTSLASHISVHILLCSIRKYSVYIDLPSTVY